MSSPPLDGYPRYRSIVILTGAGISAESGVPTFRGPDGLWEGHRIEDVATPEAYARDPELVQTFYNARRAKLASVHPNPAHVALAQLEAAYAENGWGEVLVVTQNVDDLHERGGSKNLIHMHGELKKAQCTRCHTVAEVSGDLWLDSQCGACGAIGTLRPHIVWFGETPLQMDDIEAALARCDLFVSIGTSGNVYPAAGFISTVRYYRRADTLEINLEPTGGSAAFGQARHGPASVLVPAFVAEMLQD
jgi:NAD-dependent deacetylase